MSLREALAKSLEAQILEAYKAVGSTLEEIEAKLPDGFEYTGEFRPATKGELGQATIGSSLFIKQLYTPRDPLLIIRPKPVPTYPVVIYIPVVENGKHICEADRGLGIGERCGVFDGTWEFFRRIERQMTAAQIAELERGQ